MKNKNIYVLIILVLITGLYIYNNQKITNINESIEYNNTNYGEVEYSQGFSNNLSVIKKDTNDNERLDLLAKSSLLININSKEAIYYNNVYERIYPASLTKVMTALLALELGNLDSKVLISENTVIDENGAKLSNIHPGDVLTLEQLLYGLMLNSGNDCGIAIAEHIAGSTENFIQMMNDRAKEIGAVDTNFTNPHGLHNDNHYTTVYDLYLIFNEAIKNKDFLKIISTPQYTVQYTDINGKSLKIKWENSNQYVIKKENIGNNVNVIGGKTGYTSKAGTNLMILSTYKESSYISIVVGIPYRDQLYKEMTKLILEIVK